MAEKVEIRGGELDGSILNNAATEATLLRLVSLMEKSTGMKSTGPGAGAGGSNNGAKLQEMYTRSLSANNRNLNTASKTASSLGDSFNKTKDVISGSVGIVGNLLTKTFGAALSGAAFAVNGLKDFLVASANNFRETANVGAAFGNDMTKLGQIATQNGMSMSQFGKLITENSKILTALGGSATGGAKRLAELRDEIFRPGGVAEGLNGLGLTSSDIETYMGSYLETQRTLGGLERRNTRELAAATAGYVEELDKVSKLTGANRRDLEASARRQALDPVITAMRGTITSTEQMNKAIANMTAAQAMGGQELEEALKEIATGVITTPLARELTATGALTREAAEGIVMGTRDAGEELARSARIMEASNRYNNATLIQGNETIRAGARYTQQMRQYQNANTRAAREESAQRNALTAAFFRFPEILNQIRNKVFGAFLNSPFFNRVLEFLTKTADAFSTAIERIDFGNLITNFMNIIGGAFDGISSVVGPFFSRISDFFTSTARSIDFDALKATFERVFGTALRLFNDALNNTIYPMIARATDVMGTVGPKIAPIFEEFGTVINSIVEFFTTKIIPLLTPVGNLLINSINPFVDMIGGIVTVLRGIVTGDFSTVMDGFGRMFTSIGDQISNFTRFIRESFDAFGRSFRSLGEFFNNVPLYIEKYISEISVLGSLAQRAGLVRSTADIDREIGRRAEESRRQRDAETAARTGTATPATVTGPTTPTGQQPTQPFATAAQNSPELQAAIREIASGVITSALARELVANPDLLALASTQTPAPTPPDAGAGALVAGARLAGRLPPVDANRPQTQTRPQVESGMQPPTGARTTPNSANLAQNANAQRTTPSGATPATPPSESRELATALAQANPTEALQNTLTTLNTNLGNLTQEQSRQLNTLIEQLLTLNRQQLEVSQDLLRAARGTNRPL